LTWIRMGIKARTRPSAFDSSQPSTTRSKRQEDRRMSVDSLLQHGLDHEKSALRPEPYHISFNAN
jgi:hypothetical protein